MSITFYVGIPTLENSVTQPSFLNKSGDLVLDNQFLSLHPACWPRASFEETVDAIEEYKSEGISINLIARCELDLSLTDSDQIMNIISMGITGNSTYKSGMLVKCIGMYGINSTSDLYNL